MTTPSAIALPVFGQQVTTEFKLTPWFLLHKHKPVHVGVYNASCHEERQTGRGYYCYWDGEQFIGLMQWSPEDAFKRRNNDGVSHQHIRCWRGLLDALSAEAKAARVEHLSRQSTLGQLRELLAVLHGDGGHYSDEHGLPKAVADAELKWYVAAAVAAERASLDAERVAIKSDTPLFNSHHAVRAK